MRRVSGFLGLIGQYSFLLHRYHMTPAERQHERPARVQVLVKPRAVLQVHGGCTDLLCRHSDGEMGVDEVENIERCHAQGCRPARREDVVSVSLIEFPYRWQVYALRDKLQADPERFRAAKLFLSTGWEDCILILWNENERAFWDNYRLLNLGSSRHSNNTQTYLGFGINRFPDAEEVDVDEGEWLDPDLPLPRTLIERSFQNIRECTGRFDLGVTWKADSSAEMAQRLCELPGRFWQCVDKLSISCEFNVAALSDPATAPVARFTGEIGLCGQGFKGHRS
ncbi:hypothetical protein ThidrDRAFT_4664 [Thiorhodococcus drewsii AZ1]|uniref:Uncharacterized protein n=2 Tax=Thiorhodococcus drewsii TaxID=210408 RepID=G2E8Q0_9GAMM|nr:hypothetical protein ThidrDRAFT_4664 [Thiorhodococcus drewsii AZ1]